MFFASQKSFNDFVKLQIKYIQQDINRGMELKTAYDRHVGHRVYGEKVRTAVKQHFKI